MFDFGQVDLHVHGVRRGVHHLLLLFLQAFSHCLDGFSPFFPEKHTGSSEIRSAQSPYCFLINTKAISNEVIKVWLLFSNSADSLHLNDLGIPSLFFSFLRCVCILLASPQGSPRGRCARWQWSTAGSGWWMCWAWVVPSSSAGILTTAREERNGRWRGGPPCRGAEERNKTQLQQFIFIATLTDTVG